MFEAGKYVLFPRFIIYSNIYLDLYFQVKDIHLFPDLFSVDNGLLTPTFKAKRADLKKYFAAEIDQMYSKLQ